MDLLNSIIKAEHPSHDSYSLRAILSRYGEIATFVSCNVDQGPKQCFVRYSTSQQAQQAYDAQDTVPGLQVYMLRQDPSLLNQYISLHVSNVAQGDKYKQAEDTHSLPVDRAYTETRYKKSYDPKGKDTIGSSRPATPPSASNAKTHFEIVHRREAARSGIRTAPVPRAQLKKQTTQLKENLGKQPTSEVHSTRFRASPYLYRLRSPYRSTENPSEHSPQEGPLGAVRGSSEGSAGVLRAFSMATHVELNVAGENFMYDLKKLEEDPKSIIELLKLASAERGHWMIVAAFYRRRGNSSAAVKLLMELIEVLKHHDVHEDKMKPRYLMLSGCEADLAESARNTDSASKSASIHYRNSQTWLQKVYGTFSYHRSEDQMAERPKTPPNRAKNSVSPGSLSCNFRRSNIKFENSPQKRSKKARVLYANKRKKNVNHYRPR